MVTLEEYRIFTRSVSVYPKEKGTLYCSLGLQNEIGEFITTINEKKFDKQRFIKEAGDVMWYITRLMDELNIPIENQNFYSKEFEALYAFPRKEIDMDIMRYRLLEMEERLGTAYGVIKKSVRGDGKFSEVRFVDAMRSMFTSFIIILATANVKLEQVMFENVRKLSSRDERGVVMGDGDDR
jgi:NTP pyrophosphatase (non-canonical NTP hydrolase)